jgi:hypothetical protein
MYLMLEDTDVTKLQPVFAFDTSGTKRFLDPSFAVATRTQPAPARPDASLIIAQAEAAALEVYLTAHAM